MQCKFYLQSPHNPDETYIVDSYDVTEENILFYKRKMEDFLSFHFLLKNTCVHHIANDVKIHFLDFSSSRMFTINANCKICCKSHLENMQHVNFTNPPISEPYFFQEVIQLRNLMLQVREPYSIALISQFESPALISQWPLLLPLYCVEKKGILIFI